MSETPRQRTRAEILHQLQLGMRDGFRHELAGFLAHSPTRNAEALQAFGEKHPDRWAACVAILAKCSGVADRHEISTPGSLTAYALKLEGLSDAEVMIEQRRLEAERDTEQRVLLERASKPPDAPYVQVHSTFGHDGVQ